MLSRLFNRTNIINAIILASIFAFTDNLIQENKPAPINVEGTSYSLSLTSANKPTIPVVGFGTGTGSSKSVTFAYTLADEVVTNKHVILSSAGGTIANNEQITGFTSISVVFTGGTLTLYSGNTVSPTTNAHVLTSSSAETISNIMFIRLVASSSDTTIESIAVDYSCENSPTSDGSFIFELISGNTEYQIYSYTGAAAAVVIPSTYLGLPVTAIRKQAFSSKSFITSVVIPNSITTIGQQAFDYNTSLTSITIPNSVTSLGGWLFYGCNNLVSVTLPNNISSLPTCIFYGCVKLTSISIPVTVTTIYGSAFSGCSSLASVSFQGTVAQWTSVFKDVQWSYQVPAPNVTCTNGTGSIA